MSKIVGVIHARMTSTRLPGKVLMELKGKTVFTHHIERMRQCRGMSSIYLATAKNPINKALIEASQGQGVSVYAGSEEDVLERLVTIAEMENADAVIRCGCDKPLFSYEIAQRLIDEFNQGGGDYLYASNIKGRGIGVELFSRKALKTIHKDYQGEFITNFIHEFPHLFCIRGIEVEESLSWKGFRLALDTKEDWELIKIIYDRFYQDGVPVQLASVLKFLDSHPEIANINRFVSESEGNSYVNGIKDMPVFSLYQNRGGRYVLKNRMGQTMSYNEFLKFLNQAQWEEYPEKAK